LRRLQAAGQATDAALLQREAHTIKGLLATFSDDAGADLAFALEKQAGQARLLPGLRKCRRSLRACRMWPAFCAVCQAGNCSLAAAALAPPAGS
jgi:HPt (histidine-containing phosphotransfer) domain-containing protein